MGVAFKESLKEESGVSRIVVHKIVDVSVNKKRLGLNAAVCAKETVRHLLLEHMITV